MMKLNRHVKTSSIHVGELDQFQYKGNKLNILKINRITKKVLENMFLSTEK